MALALRSRKYKFLSQQIVKAFILTAIFFYFGSHLLYGQNGIFNYMKQKAKLEQLDTELSTVEGRRTTLTNKVHRLYTNSLDADLLDEQYRRTTGNVKPNEAVYYYKD